VFLVNVGGKKRRREYQTSPLVSLSSDSIVCVHCCIRLCKKELSKTNTTQHKIEDKRISPSVKKL
jgi:hypothetical protein